MDNWGVQIAPEPLRLTGRVLDREKVLFNPKLTTFDVNPQGDFTMAMRSMGFIPKYLSLRLKQMVTIISIDFLFHPR